VSSPFYQISIFDIIFLTLSKTALHIIVLYILKTFLFVQRLQWTRVLYSVVITRHSNPPISQFNSPCNESRVSNQYVYTIVIINL